MIADYHTSRRRRRKLTLPPQVASAGGGGAHYPTLGVAFCQKSHQGSVVAIHAFHDQDWKSEGVDSIHKPMLLPRDQRRGSGGSHRAKRLPEEVAMFTLVANRVIERLSVVPACCNFRANFKDFS